MTATKTTVTLDSIYDAMRECYKNSLTAGCNWHAVTVGTDGVPYCREEVSRCVSESEYFGRGEPYPVTVYSVNGCSEISEDEIDNEVDAFDPVEQFAGYGGIEELISKLETAGFSVEY
jgi:hypothetical protein